MTILAQVVLAADSTIPADIAINTLHFEVFPESGVSTRDEILVGGGGILFTASVAGAVSQLYDSMSSVIGSAVDPALSLVRFYDLTLPSPRAPVAEAPLNSFGPTGTTQLPSEVAICSSFEAQKLSGFSQASRRNRVYIGPLATNVVNGTNGRVGTLPQATIADAFEAMALTSSTEPRWTWVVYSGKLSASYQVNNGWVDDAFDTQRRRGVDPTARTTWVQDSGA